METILKILAVVAIVCGVYAVIVQYNDPDSVKWYIVYGVSVVASILFLKNKLPFWLAVVLALAYFIGVFIDWPAKFEGVTIGGGDITNIEEGRESLGLLITGLIMAVYAIGIRSKV